MEEDKFKEEVKKFKEQTREEITKREFNWKSFSKRVFDMWISTSANIYNRIVKVSTKERKDINTIKT